MPFLPLESQTWDVEVVGPLAEVVVHQRFSNPTGGFVDATYLFPLDPGAVVERMVLHVGDRVIRSAIAGREEARARFDDAAAKGQVAALLSERASSLFAQELSNLPPWSSVEIELTLIQPVEHTADGWELALPLVSPPRLETRGLYLPTDAVAQRSIDPLRARLGVPVDVTAVVHASADLAELTSPTHTVDTALHGSDGRAVLWAAEADRDFVLRWTEAPRDAPAFALLLGDDQAMLEVSPPELAYPDLLSRELVWVDAGSGSGAAVLEADALSAARATLRDDDTLVTTPSLGQALALPPDPRRRRTIVLAGTTPRREELGQLDTLAARSDLSVVLLGLGPVPDRDLLQTLAEVGGGPVVFLELGAPVSERAQAVAAAVAPPILTDLRVDWADCPADQVSPSRLPDLRVGEPARVYAHVPSCFGPVWVSGTSNGRRVEWAVWPERSSQPRLLAVAWARARVAELERQQRTGRVADASAEVRELGLAWGVVTSQTSLVAVDPLVRNLTGERVAVTEPLMGDRLEGFVDGGMEVLVVEAQARTIDTSSTSRSTVLTRQELAVVPTGRSYQSAVQLSPGRSAGGTANENTYLLDGATLTDPVTGTSSMNFAFGALQQVEVLLAGYSPEFGGIRPVVEVVTRSGTNNLEGAVGVDQTRRLGDDDAALSGTSAAAWLSGPLVRDRVWFLGSYGYDTSELADPTLPEVARGYTGHTGFAKLTAQPTPEHRFTGLVAGDEARVVAPLEEVEQLAWRGSGSWSWFVSPSVNVDTRVSSGWLGVAGDRRASQLASTEVAALNIDDPLGGRHDLKGGVEVQHAAWTFGSDWASGWLGVPVPDASARVWGSGFVQDAWRPHGGVTLTGGFRLDAALGRVHPGPRLYAAWDPWNDDRTKLAGGYGRRYGTPGLATDLVDPEAGLPSLDELLGLAEREVVRDVALGVDATWRRERGLPVYGGGRADRTTWSLAAHLRKVASRRWGSELSWTWTWLQDDPGAVLLVGEAGQGSYGSEGVATAFWQLPTDPWTMSVGALGTVLAEPLGRFVPDPTVEGLSSGPRWTAGARVEQAVDLRKGQLLLRAELFHLGTLGPPPSPVRPIALETPWLDRAGWEGTRFEGHLGYEF